MKKIVIIGGTGTIGSAVVNELKAKHEVIVAGHESGDIHVDITSAQSIENLYQKVKSIDAIISTAGSVVFAPLNEMTLEKYQVGLNNKLLGQVNLVLIGMKYLNDKGSFTLTSGILDQDPIYMSSSASMVNGALNSFVIQAAIELTRGLRINIISPTVLREAMDKYADFFPGFKPVAASEVALAYRKSVDGLSNGKVFEVGH